MDKKYLLEAELKAKALFHEIIKSSLIEPGKTEEFLSSQIFDLAFKMFNTKVHWHKRIVRTGSNTIHPYNENPPNLVIKEDDILFLDFGPIFNNWEADIGRTYVLGNDSYKLKLLYDVEECWQIARNHFIKKKNITASEMYYYVEKLANERSWNFGNEHCGHLIGKFPHKNIKGEKVTSYLHPENHTILKNQKKINFFWILEIHFVDYEKKVGGFYEQLLL